MRTAALAQLVRAPDCESGDARSIRAGGSNLTAAGDQNMELIGDSLLCLTPEEANGLAGLLRGGVKTAERQLHEPLRILADMLQKEQTRERMSPWMFTVSVQPKRTKQ